MTHTYATLEISPAAYEEIAGKLRAAEYHHAFDPDNGVIDMHGIGLVRAAPVATFLSFAREQDAVFRAWWRSLGGRFHGPNVETATIPEADLFKALRDQRAPIIESGWLIENGRQGDDVQYICMVSGFADWTSNIEHALRFARQVDADKFSENAIGWIPVEHAWG